MTTPSDRFPARPRIAVLVVVLAALPALAGVLWQVASRVELTPDALFLVVDAMVGLVYGAVAAVVLSRRSHPVVWLIALAALGGGLSALGGGWAQFAASRSLPMGEAAISAFGTAWVPGTLGLFLVLPWLVRETPLPARSRVGLVVGVLVTAAFTIQRLAFPMADNQALLLLVVVWGLVAGADVAWRARCGPEAERPGLGLLAAGTAVMALSFLPLLLVPYTSAGVVLLVPVLHLVCQALFPGALLVTLLRNRLWGIDLAVSRAVLGGLLVLGIALVYAALVWAVTVTVGSAAIAQLVAAVGVVIVVQPLRSVLERRVRRMVWGEAASPGRAALRVGESLASVQDAHLLLDRLAAAIGESLRLESVSLALAEAPDIPLGRWGEATSIPIEQAVREGGAGPAVLGILAVTPRPGERLDRRSLETLDGLQPILAAGFALVRSAREVGRARDAATGARLAERRLIRRELHDGIGPWLSGLRLGLQGARNLLRTDPAAADRVLEALQDEAARRVQDVRMLSRSLLPPILEEQGLGAALAELVRGHAERGFAVEVTTAPGPDPDGAEPAAAWLRGLDPRVAAAAYAVISESVLNAARHSGARRCRVEVSLAGDTATLPEARLILRCSDAGSGRPDDVADGVGTASMRERVHELEGTLEIAAGDRGSGTMVHAELPLHPAEVRG
ncbi:sensor histidine kinase [Brachybacterium hainanense]|uniref:histidine kinase n=1 Tax=Brachybacterium hainanense TaxID=1541174 RepID=A0ABV6R7L4_9MICO